MIIDPDFINFNLTIRPWHRMGFQEAGEWAEVMMMLDFIDGKQ